MSKILQGKIVSNKMEKTVVVEVSRLVPHPMYKKLLKRSKKYLVDTKGQKVIVGQTVKIIETRPIAKNKHFALLTTEKAIEPVVKEKTIKAKKESKS